MKKLIAFFIVCLFCTIATAQANSYPVSSMLGDFVVTDSQLIPELQLQLTELTHRHSGARILHLLAPDPENMFCLSFCTLPESSNGVAHVLEHTVLEGSKKFPVRHLFEVMKKRSSATFMNAFTSADSTYYVAASKIEDDFYNLLEVYMDAVFHPLLDPKSFAQEGHRLEFARHNDPSSSLQYKGVVYNEMKGIFHSPYRRLMRAVNEALFPDSPYRFVSGGLPAVIPTLTHEELLGFHKKHYYPGNCLFFFYGDIPLEKHLAFLEKQAVLQAPLQPPYEIPATVRRSEPVYQELFYPATKEDNTMIAYAWLTAPASGQEELVGLQLLDSLLMGSDAAPLKRRLLQSGLCKKATTYFDTSRRDSAYLFLLEGSSKEKAEDLQEIIYSTLREVAQQGFSEEMIDRVMREMELTQNEIRPDNEPFGLSLFERCDIALHKGARPREGLCLQLLLEKLRCQLKERPSLFSDYISTHFLENRHFARVVLIPNAALVEDEVLQERQTLGAIKKLLSDDEIANIVALAAEMQQETDDAAAMQQLPAISLTSIPRSPDAIYYEQHLVGDAQIFYVPSFTNHLTYLDMVVPLPPMEQEDLWVARLFCQLVNQIGAGGHSFEENLHYIQEHTGGITASLSLCRQAQDAKLCYPSFWLSGKATDSKNEYLFQIFSDIARTLCLTDTARLKELVMKHAAELDNSLNNDPIQYVLQASVATSTIGNYMHYCWNGVDYVQKISHIAHHFDQESEALVKKLSNFYSQLFASSPIHLVLTCDQTAYGKMANREFEGLAALATQKERCEASSYDLARVSVRDTLLIAAPVAYNAIGFSLLHYSHPDSAAVAAAAQLFSTTVLHKRIREQGGAYGGGSFYDPTSANFIFYSYRDPHIASTFAAFAEAVNEIGEGRFDETELQSAKLKLFQKLDAPVSPKGRGKVAYEQWCAGKSDELLQAFRERVFALSCKDVQEAVRTHIAPAFAKAGRVTFANQQLLSAEQQSEMANIIAAK